MAKFNVEVHVDLWDYFSKFGMGDGDNGAATDIGYSNRGQAVTLIRAALDKNGLQDVRVREEDSCSCHNNCRIELTLSGESLDIDDGVIVGAPEVLRGAITASLNEAYDEFEKKVSK